jgi:hypothetical protein
VPLTEVTASFDYLVGPAAWREWNGEAECLGSLEVVAHQTAGSDELAGRESSAPRGGVMVRQSVSCA